VRELEATFERRNSRLVFGARVDLFVWISTRNRVFACCGHASSLAAGSLRWGTGRAEGSLDPAGNGIFFAIDLEQKGNRPIEARGGDSQDLMIKLVAGVLGKKLSWRLGRALYLAARGEGANEMETNGERLLVERLVEVLASRTGGEEPPVIVDCGANLGNWTAMALKALATRGLQAHFHLMEPAPATFESTSRRYAGRSDVELHPIALSDHEGSADFYLVSPTGGRNSLVDSEHRSAERIQVRVARGSDYFARMDVDQITLLKIDTEGNDYAVLQGFSEMLAGRRIQLIQFEYNFRWLAVRRSLRNVFELAESHGYRVGKADGRSIVVYKAWNAELDRYFEWNYLLIHPDLVAPLRAREASWSESNTLVEADR
jgi:FkbM family methyltransferase